MDSGGTPVADGNYTMRFRIYDASSGGNLEWDSGDRSVQVTNGLFEILLGEDPQPSINLTFAESYWLLVTFAGDNQLPRQRLGSVGYAFMASGMVPGTEIEGWVNGGFALKGTNTSTIGSSVGIYAESYSNAGQGVYGAASSTNGTTFGVYGISASTSGRGVYGEASSTTGITMGGYFKNASSSGTAVYGEATSATGTTYGVNGYTNSTSGRGVYGRADRSTGENYGGYFLSNSSNGTGVYGEATALSGTTFGVRGESSSSGGTGVRGDATATSGTTYGVRGSHASTSGAGVYGSTSASSGTTYGVYGWSTSSAGRGVYGAVSTTYGYTYGVYGETNSSYFESSGVCGHTTTSTGTSSGVFGSTNSSTTFATGVRGAATASTGQTFGGYFWSESDNGRGIMAEGNFTGGNFEDRNSSAYGRVGYSTYKLFGSGSDNFVQNHPYDDGLVVAYSALEGNEVGTYTRGTARLENGKARINLDETFAFVTNPDIGLTVHLTPRGMGSILFVESLTTSELIVRSMEGFPSDIEFDYIIYGLRIGFEEVSIVQEKDRETYIPSMKDHRDLFARRPDLRRYNSLERFKEMRISKGILEPVDLSASRMLRDAIKEYDPSIHGPVGIEAIRKSSEIHSE